MKEFKGWLKDTRAELENHVNPKITPAVLRRWHNKRILPFWDLTFIAEIENRTIPDHILGDALFPDSEVDVTERVRKRTTEICEAAFSLETIGALRAQGILDSLPPKKIHV